MNFYKFTRNSGIYQIKIKEDPNSTEVTSYFNGDVIFSEEDEVFYGSSYYVLNKDDGLYYETYDPKKLKRNFTKTIATDSTVVSATKTGIDIYDANRGAGKIISHADVGDHLILNLGFIDDNAGNIWASISYMDSDGLWKDGYIIYKNHRNNFANVTIPDFSYNTVLTGGVLDNEKIATLRESAVIKKSTRRRASSTKSSSSSTTTSTTSSNKSTKTTSTTEFGRFANVESFSGTVPLTKEELNDIYDAEDLDVRTLKANFNYNIDYYNRFKKAMPDDTLSKGFMHIFFTRPDLNILSSDGNSLESTVGNNAFMKQKFKEKPDLLRQLVKGNGSGHDFMMLLSNKASSFGLTDESIKYGDYGKTYHSQSIQIGKGLFESYVSGTLDVKYTDTRDLDLLSLHRIWIQYISNVYHGVWDPKVEYIWRRVLDYACAVYVIVTAEDFETILSCTKYYGVFPVNVPWSAISWDAGTVITKPDYTITYGYSTKEVANPAILTDLNTNSFSTKKTSANYIPSFNSNYGRAGTTWVGAPFVETITDASGKNGSYGTGVIQKLRFQPGPKTY
jgi:hypothetical protein